MNKFSWNENDIIPVHVPLLVLSEERVEKFFDARKKKAPTARQQTLFTRRERKLSNLGLVNVETAGDSKVCPVCEDIADEGPYSIDTARGLIPAHPSCRCAFIPLEEDDE